MKSHIVAVGVALLASACANPIAPQAVSPITLSPSRHTSPALRPADHPAVSSVVGFDPTQLGHVTVSNTSTSPHTYLLVVWLQTAADEVEAAHTMATVPAGQRADLTVGVSTRCGAMYQRDVYVDAMPQDRYTDSDLNNLAFYAPGQYWTEAPCDAPPPAAVPSVEVVCPINNILIGGVCLPATPPDDYL